MIALTEDKMSYANTRLIEEMCEQEPYQLRVHGYEEDLEEITPSVLYDYYQQMLQEDRLDVFVVGDLDGLDVEPILEKLLQRKQQVEMEKTSINVATKEEATLIEYDQIQQAKLHLGYRTNITYDDKDYATLHVFNGLFGGFPNSKLFLNVREKHSLAYYAASRIESHKGLLFVFSGIAPDQYEKAREIILEQMEQMRKGDFSDDQIAETKEMTINQLRETLDNPQGMIELTYQKVLAKSNKTITELIEEVQSVTRDQIVKVANQIQLDKIFLLTSEGQSQMKNKYYDQIDETIYTEVLENGLKVCILPKTEMAKTFAIFTTNYGSIDQSFVPIDQKDLIKVPDGIAHFFGT